MRKLLPILLSALMFTCRKDRTGPHDLHLPGGLIHQKIPERKFRDFSFFGGYPMDIPLSGMVY